MRAVAALLALVAAFMAATAPEPANRGTLNDLSADAVYILNQCPGVGVVEQLVSVERPRRRIVHILDVHPVTLDDFVADIRDQDPAITDAEIAAACLIRYFRGFRRIDHFASFFVEL